MYTGERGGTEWGETGEGTRKPKKRDIKRSAIVLQMISHCCSEFCVAGGVVKRERDREKKRKGGGGWERREPEKERERNGGGKRGAS